MTEPSYPLRRETERLRRWYETAGAEYRLCIAVAGSAELRRAVEDGLVQSGGMALRPLDLGQGEIVPAVFRDYRGTHSSFRLFVFDGLGERVRRDGAAALAELERGEGLFRRPATWSLLWLDDAALLPLLDRLAPTFTRSVQLHPTFLEEGLTAMAGDPALGQLLAAALPRAREGSGSERLDLEAGARLLLERGDLPALRRMLRDAPLAAEPLLLATGEADLLASDPQRALAHLAAAAALAGPRRAEALATLALVQARLGDRDLAGRLLAGARAATGSKLGRRRIARAARAVDGSGSAAARQAEGEARAAAAGDAAELHALASEQAAEGAAPVAVEELLQAARAAAPAPALAARIAADLALAIARQCRQRPERAGEVRLQVEAATGAGGNDADLASTRARRALGRLALAESAGAAGPAADKLLDEADSQLRAAFELARAGGLVLESIECQWDMTAVAAAREDLAATLEALEQVQALAREAGLRRHRFEGLEKHARALRLGHDLARATGELDELESLAYDLTWPDLELAALRARGDHLAAIGVPGEARTAYARAAAIALATGDLEAAAALRTSAGG